MSDFPLDYRIFATIIHLIILIVGLTGNCALIWVAWKSKSLKTPTYAYLVSEEEKCFFRYINRIISCALVPVKRFQIRLVEYLPRPDCSCERIPLL